MDVFFKYTVKSLRQNRTRTVVTVIGIILSVAMFTAVTESMVSGQAYLLNGVKTSVGSFHYVYYNIEPDTLSKIQSDGDFSSVAYMKNNGYAKFDSANEYMPYLHIAGISENFTDMAAVCLTEGRMPENGGEIVISKHAVTDAGGGFRVGDVLTLELGRRMLDGYELWQDIPFNEQEKFEPLYTKTYTVVGLCLRPDEKIERYEAPGYTCYTVDDGSVSASSQVFVIAAQPAQVDRLMSEKFDLYGYGMNMNYDLLTYQGYGNEGLTGVALGLGTLLIVIIMLGSVALIYNSFSISVSERTKQFGILRSVGATKRQMRRTVSYEALMLCAAGVPFGLIAGCAGIAVTFRLLADEFDTVTGEFINTVSGAARMHLVLSAPALLCAAAVSVITVLISARIPLRRALKLSAVEAVRMSADIKEKKKKFRTPAFIYKLFGFPGFIAHKNFSRSRRRYRTVIASLTASFVLFISAASLCNYFTETFEMRTDIDGCDIEVGFNPNRMSGEEMREMAARIAAIKGVEDYALLSSYDEYLIVERGSVSETFEKENLNADSLYADGEFARYFLDDAQFKKLTKTADTVNIDFFNKNAPAAILYDNIEKRDFDEEGKEIYLRYKMFPVNKLPYDLTLYKAEQEMDGFIFDGEAGDENGKFTYYSIEGENDIKTKKFTAEECLTRESVTIGGRAQKAPFYIENRRTVLIYPESMKTAVLGEKTDRNYMFMYILSDDHAAVASQLEKMITDSGEGFFFNDYAAENEKLLSLTKLIRVFSYGFISLISLIAAANVFNTVSTNITLRRRELAMLRSAGMGEKAFNRMYYYESLIYGVKTLLWGVPLCAVISVVMFYIVSDAGFDTGYLVPWGSVAAAVISIFAVVFASILYSAGKLKNANTADELKNENI
ncbi:MAG: ABC transporter permease [Clostridia bacterium]|nr:ABC transporter permease [Clostridia bacterium]